MLKSTIGQLVVNDILPDDLRDYNRVLDKKGISELLAEVAKRHPEKYRDISHKLLLAGDTSAYLTGSNSFGLKHMTPSAAGLRVRGLVQERLNAILGDDSLDPKKREEAILMATSSASANQADEILAESLKEHNPLAYQLKGAGRGNKNNLASLRGSDMLYADHHGNVIPVPVLKSYAEGLTPAQYWASSYGARAGVLSAKLSVADAGFLSKQMNQIAHRTMVTAVDDDKPYTTLRGLPVDTTDDESEGSLLAHDIGGYKRNTILTPKILKHLREQNIDQILVRSPAITGSPEGGVYSMDVGVREKGGFVPVGENPALSAVQALSEPISQGTLSEKHKGGVASGVVASKVPTGFKAFQQLIQTPKTFQGGATHAQRDGYVQSIEPSPAGGYKVKIEGEDHYVSQGFGLKVKPGDTVEAGDVLSEGMPNPAQIVKHKGIGEGRRYFINTFRQTFRDSNIRGHRRNIELFAKGLINHVKLNDEINGFVPDDVIPYSYIESNYEPREGFKTLKPSAAVGEYLERPYLHYSIGTRIKPSMLKTFDKFGVNEIDVHPDEPAFEPVMIRGMDNLSYDPDFMTRMLGSGLKSSLMDAVHRGGTSDEHGTSYVPTLAKAVDFGRSGILKSPGPPIKPISMPKAILR